MNEVDAASKILKTMLGKLGFEVELEVTENEDGPCLNIVTENDANVLIGRGGDRLEDLQYLLNRILVKHFPEAPRFRVDCDGYRANKEAILIEEAKEIARKVQEDGKSRKLKPLNAYYRRMVYHALAEIEGVRTSSSSRKSRYKNIYIERV